jgi:RimJ/RimL family protein N-acetyltransferase
LYTKKDLLDIVIDQLAIEYNCKPGDFSLDKNVLTVPALHPQRRRYNENGNFFKMVTLGANAILCADAGMHAFLSGYIRDKAGHWLFEHDKLLILDKELGQYGKRLMSTFHMFLPVAKGKAQETRYPVKWFEEDEIHPFYAGGQFPNALCRAYDPNRPDMLAVAAYENGAIVGMAGCSADTPLLWQIGIDVSESHRGRGLGTYLVTLLKDEIQNRGKIPFYGTSLSNLHSWNIAINCGFRPAWIEICTEEE